MGYSSEAILAKPEFTENEINQLLSCLGFSDYVFNRMASFEEAESRNKHGIYIGNCNKSSYLIFEGIFNHMRKANFNDVEKKITTTFPSKEFLSIINVESVNGYLYHYFKDNKTIRLKEGSDCGIQYNIGDELEIEKEYYVKKEIINEKEYFFTKSYNDENKLDKWSHDQIGGDVAFKLAKHFFGVEYYHDDLFYSVAKQYISIKDVNNLELFLSSDKSIEEFDLDYKIRDFFPTKLYIEIIESVKEILCKEGFVYDSESLTFVRTKNGITNIISFKTDDKGIYLATPSLRFKLETPLIEWYKEKFNREENRFGNKNEPYLKISTSDLGIQTRNPFKLKNDSKTITIKKDLIEYLNETILPYFQLLDNYEKIAEHAGPWDKIDLYLMAGNQPNAQTAFLEFFNSAIRSTIKEKWSKDKIEKLMLEFQDRTKLFDTDIDIKSLYDKINVEYFLEMEDEQKKKNEINQFEKKENRLKEIKQIRKWWKFWK